MEVFSRQPSYPSLRNTPSRKITNPRFERNADGEVEFIIKIEFNDFLPEDISVVQEGLTVSVDAIKKALPEIRRPSNREYHKVLNLPFKSDMTKHMKASYEDNFLVIRMCTIPQLYSSTIYRNTKEHLSAVSIQSDEPVFYTHNIPIDKDIVDGSFSVNVDDYMVHVTIFKETKDRHGCPSHQEFSSEHKFPTSVVIEKLKAELNECTLTLSAPYRYGYEPPRSSRTTKSSTSIFY